MFCLNKFNWQIYLQIVAPTFRIIDTDTIENTPSQLPACSGKDDSGMNHKIIMADSDAMYYMLFIIVFRDIQTTQPPAKNLNL